MHSFSCIFLKDMNELKDMKNFENEMKAYHEPLKIRSPS